MTKSAAAVLMAVLLTAVPAVDSLAQESRDDSQGGFADLTDEVITSSAEELVGDAPPADENGKVHVTSGGRQIRDRPPVRTFGDIVLSSDCPTGEARVELIWIDPDTGEWTDYEGFQCVPYSEIGNDRDDTAPPPASAHAPARDSVAEAIPDRVVQLNPFPRGMTGMETWYWYDDDGDADTAPTTELSVAASVPGVTVTSTAAITAYCWDVDGDGVDEVCADSPGSEQQPVLTHVYESTGTYQVRLTVTWGGSFSVNGAPPVAFDPVQRTYTVDYEVIEVRSVLTG